MKKEIVIATLITGLLTSISAEESKSVKIKEIKVDKVGKIEASKQIQGQISAKKDLKKVNPKAIFDDNSNTNCGGCGKGKLDSKIKEVEKIQINK